MRHEPHRVVLESRGRAPRKLRRLETWTFWKVPFFCGLGLCAAQLLRFVMVFGSGRSARGLPRISSNEIELLLSGLGLFFIVGALTGMIIQAVRTVRTGPWRIYLIAATALCTLLTLPLSLVGGLLGMLGVVIYPMVPFAIFVGLPALVREAWRSIRPAQAPSGP